MQSANNSSVKVKKKTFPLVFQKETDSVAEDSEMNLYFVNGGDVPYVAVSEFMPFFGSLYEDQKVGVPAITFDIKNDGGTYLAERTDTGSAMAFDPAKDTIDFASYDGFLQSPGDTSLVGFVKIGEEGTGGVSRLMKAGKGSYDRQGYMTIFDLSKYEIDIIEANGGVTRPCRR